MSTLSDIKSTFRSISRAEYPELAVMGPEHTYEGKMGPGGLYLAVAMARTLNLKPRSRVMDLGCGAGTTSIFLARQYGVQVVSVDLWIAAEQRQQRFEAAGVAEQVLALRMDIRQPSPFAEGSFDAIFCMDAIHYFGQDPATLSNIVRLLKAGGRMVVGSPCFDREFTPEQIAIPPPTYNDSPTLWPNEFSKYHSPPWWGEQFVATGLVSLLECQELSEGQILWEDDTLDSIARGQSPEQALRDANQILFGRRYPEFPVLTHFLLMVQRLSNAR